MKFRVIAKDSAFFNTIAPLVRVEDTVREDFLTHVLKLGKEQPALLAGKMVKFSLSELERA